MTKTDQRDSAAETDEKSDQPSDSSDAAKKREAEMEETGEENAA